MTDLELVRQYREGSQDAFSQLVARHVHWIRSAALRQVRDAHLADDVTQAVFIVLARKASSLGKGTIVTAWLFHVMRFACRDALRSENRRTAREKLAAEMIQQRQANQAKDEWADLSPLLEQYVARLRSRDRQAILLRFYQGKSFPQVAIELGISEDAARKRVGRAIEKLRGNFAGRGITVSSAALPALMLAHLTQSFGTQLTANVAGAAMNTSAASASSISIANAVGKIMAMAKLQMLGAAAAVVAVTVIALVLNHGTGASETSKDSHSITSQVRTPTASLPANRPPVLISRATSSQQLPATFGWPQEVALPGSITSTPSVADLDGDGKLEIIVTCMGRKDDADHGGYVNPGFDGAACVYAFHSDGSLVKGFPVELLSAVNHQKLGKDDLFSEAWFSSPSVFKSKDGRPKFVLTTPYGQGTRVIDGGGNVRKISFGNQWSCVTVVDLLNNGTIDFVMVGSVVCSEEGKPIPGWPAGRQFDGFFGCVGDANNDGGLEIYHVTYGRNREGIVMLNSHGQPQSGWGKYGPGHLFAPVMGDITGDAKKEIVYGSDNLYAWTCDGKPIAASGDDVLVSGVQSYSASPTLADLDGDGKAEIIVVDEHSSTLRAFHGDGTSAAGEDGEIASLPAPCAGVSVADLGGDGVMDLFCGTYWVKFDPKTKKSELINMAPEGGEANVGVQPSIADVDADGKADIVLGLKDGRVIVYPTGLAFNPQLVQWPTCNANFQHTGVWEAPHAK